MKISITAILIGLALCVSVVAQTAVCREGFTSLPLGTCRSGFSEHVIWIAESWDNHGSSYYGRNFYTLTCHGRGSVELGWVNPAGGGAWDSSVATALGQTFESGFGAKLPSHSTLEQAVKEVVAHVNLALCSQ